MLNNGTVLLITAARKEEGGTFTTTANHTSSINQTISDSTSEEFDPETYSIRGISSIIMSVNGSISIVFSFAIIFHIIRSHSGLTKTYHRLVFSLCVADIITSFSYIIGTAMVPKEMSYYIPYAQGNTATCSFQGFLSLVGQNCVAFYNCSICCYYLAIIKYNKHNQYIKRKLEPWFHGVSIMVPIVIAVGFLFLKVYNAKAGICRVLPYYPPHCDGYDFGEIPKGNFTIPCGRGDWVHEYSPLLKRVLNGGIGYFPVLVTPFVIIVTMVMMFRYMLNIEKKLQFYGVRSFRQNILRATMKNVVQNENVSLRESRWCIIPPCFCREKTPELELRSNRPRSQKRYIVYMALGYASAWVFTWVPFICVSAWLNYFTGMLTTVFTPLQGLFNFIVYMAPKVRTFRKSKRNEEQLSWWQSFSKAWASKGAPGTNSLGGSNRKQKRIKNLYDRLFKNRGRHSSSPCVRSRDPIPNREVISSLAILPTKENKSRMQRVTFAKGLGDGQNSPGYLEKSCNRKGQLKTPDLEESCVVEKSRPLGGSKSPSIHMQHHESENGFSFLSSQQSLAQSSAFEGISYAEESEYEEGNENSSVASSNGSKSNSGSIASWFKSSIFSSIGEGSTRSRNHPLIARNLSSNSNVLMEESSGDDSKFVDDYSGTDMSIP